MCGLAGIIDLTGRHDIDRAKVGRMAAALLHRGPDDGGFLFAPGVGLAHRRLSIVGLDDGQQPVFNEDGSVAAICNGELFDFVERRADLQAKGHVFRSGSDSELIVHLYEEYGDALFEHLKGQFAFVLVDFTRRRVLLARDRVGICPLFVSRQGDELYFASEIKALLVSGGVPAAADPRGLDHLFTFFAQGGRRTAFAGVSAVLPGSCLTIEFNPDGSAAEPKERRYWDFDFPDWGDEYDPGDAQAVSEFESVFGRAVDLRLRADVPVVGYLSGGVDSAYINAMAAQVAGRALPSFTVRVADPSLDEASEAREAAEAIGASRQTVVEAGDELISEKYAALIAAAECPVLDTSCAALLALSGAVHGKGYKVVLAGEGADEGFAGYVWFKMRKAVMGLDIGDAFRPSTVVSRITRKWASRDRSFQDFAAIDRLIGGPLAQTPLYAFVATARSRYYGGAMWDRLGGHNAYEDLELDVARMKRWHPLNRSLYLGYKLHLPGLLLSQKGDRVAMANSVEARYPFLDEDVIAYASRLHPRFKLRGMRKDKYLLRQAAGRLLPEQIAQRPKAMFRAPLAESFLRQPPQFVRDLLSPESLAKTGYFDAQAIQRDCAELARGEGKPLGTFASLGLGGVIATQLWHHLYLGGGLCVLPEATPAAESDVKASQAMAEAAGIAAAAE
jgi:asparagine synthase (glutamine-hydrolysing)